MRFLLLSFALFSAPSFADFPNRHGKYMGTASCRSEEGEGKPFEVQMIIRKDEVETTYQFPWGPHVSKKKATFSPSGQFALSGDDVISGNGYCTAGGYCHWDAVLKLVVPDGKGGTVTFQVTGEDSWVQRGKKELVRFGSGITTD